MNTIRKSVFETNSSSSHSLSLELGNEWDTIESNDYGVIQLEGRNFGWEWEMYNDARTKAEYCLADRIDRRLLQEVIQEFTGCEVEFLADENNYWAAYVDHQSSGTVRDELHTKEQLTNFIFNKSSLLFTGNDNGEAPPNFYDPPGTIYKWELHVNEIIFKFQEIPTKNDIIESIKYALNYHKEFVKLNDDHTYYFVNTKEYYKNPKYKGKTWKEQEIKYDEFKNNPENWTLDSYKLIENETTKQI